MRAMRIKELDGVRGVAILLVLLWHYIAGQFRPDSTSVMVYLPKALTFAWSGVDLFFVLSGLLIVDCWHTRGCERFWIIFQSILYSKGL